MQNALYIRWKALAASYSEDEGLSTKLFEEIERKYSGSGRHYHNLEHLVALLNLSEKYQDQLVYKEIIDWAIFYHDIIYNVWRKDSEQRSAATAAKRLGELGLPEEKIAAVELFIVATSSHKLPNSSEYESDIRYFLDFDMSILGADWPLYENYTRQVRKEYRVYPDILYRAGRRKFLQNTLHGGPIFYTTTFRDLYEAQARKNMEREMQLLSEG